MIIAAAALNQTPLDWAGNTHRILDAIAQARAQHAEILVLPELCLSGYGCDDYFYMPWLANRALDALLQIILPATRGMLVAVGLPFAYNGNTYNTLAVAVDGALHGFYAKQILAGSGVYYEPRWFRPWPGNHAERVLVAKKEVLLGDFTVNYHGVSVGFEICEDAWHPTLRPAITGAARHAALILNASASNFARGKQAERHHLIHNLAGRNNCYYLYTNHVGNEAGRLIFDGEIIFGAAGKIVSSGKRFSMLDVVVLSFEMLPVENLHFQPEREEDDFEDFTAACSLALLDYMRKAGARGYALSLSGGADSAACAVLVAEMVKRAFLQLGKNGLEAKLGLKLEGDSVAGFCRQLLFCAYQGTVNSGPVTRHAAQAVAHEVNARFVSWEIDELVSGYTHIAEAALNQSLTWKDNDLVLQNIQARTRAPGIWMVANALNFLLITTSNRSEGDVGYCTMDGDTAGSLAPIAGVSKHFIRRWLVWAKNQLGYAALETVINQAPTAELRPQQRRQTDEADLMPYDLLEAIEVLLIYERRSDAEALGQLLEIRNEDADYLKLQLDRFWQMWKRSQWKRERLAPSFHLDRFNIDPKSAGRFPVLSK